MEPTNIPQQMARNTPSEVTGAIVDGKTGPLLEYQHLNKHPKYKERWKCSYGNKIKWLAQSMLGQVKGTNTIFFINKIEVLQNRYSDVTYWHIICGYGEGKAEPNQTRLTAGRDKINHPEDCVMPTADILTIKLLINSVMSTPNAKFMTIDINFVILTPHSNGMNISDSS